MGNALYRVALGYVQSPGKGQKAAPNLALEEQSRAPTWAAELAIANASLSSSLLHSKGPATWPGQFARAKVARGEGLGMQMPEHPYTSKNPAKKLQARKVVASVATPKSRHGRFAHHGLAHCQRLRPAAQRLSVGFAKASTVLVQRLSVGFMRMLKRCWGTQLKGGEGNQGWSRVK